MIVLGDAELDLAAGMLLRAIPLNLGIDFCGFAVSATGTGSPQAPASEGREDEESLSPTGQRSRVSKAREPSNHLIRNKHDGTFEDATRRATNSI
jgi:hypothetical protein